jgi:Ni/Co efflux regulator RcnB
VSPASEPFDSLIEETLMKRAATTVVALSVLAASVAMADPHHDHRDQRGTVAEQHNYGDRGHDGSRGGNRFGGRPDDRGGWRAENRGEWRGNARDSRGDWRGDHRNDGRDRGYDGRGRYEGQDRGRFLDHFYGERYNESWGYRDHEWRRGERLPIAYYSEPYVVRDFGAYRLRPPPWGYHWVRVNNDVVLAAIATGIVLDVVYNCFN